MTRITNETLESVIRQLRETADALEQFADGNLEGGSEQIRRMGMDLLGIDLDVFDIGKHWAGWQVSL